MVNDAPLMSVPMLRERGKPVRSNELGYRPNVAAQALARERSHTIGVLALGHALSGPSRRVFTLEHEARSAGLHHGSDFGARTCLREVSPTGSTRC